jgi:hypothetical protein
MLNVAGFDVMNLWEYQELVVWLDKAGLKAPLLSSLLEGDQDGAPEFLLYVLRDEVLMLLQQARYDEHKSETLEKILVAVKENLIEEFRLNEMYPDAVVETQPLTFLEAVALLNPILSAEYKSFDKAADALALANSIVGRVIDSDERDQAASGLESLVMVADALAKHKK